MRVVKIRRDGDDRLRHRVAEVRLSIALQLHERACADFLRRVLLAIDVVGVPLLAHEPLDAAERAVGVGDRLAFGHFTDEHFAALGKRNNRGGRSRTFGVGDDDWFAGFQHCND